MTDLFEWSFVSYVIMISMTALKRIDMTRETKQASTYPVCASQVYPSVENIRFVELLAFTFVLQTNSKIPV